MSEVNEGSTSFLTISFTDQNGTAVTPSVARYRLDKAGAAVKAWTAFTPSAATHTLTITPTENAIASSAPTEIMRVTVEWTYDVDKKGTMDTTYTLVNLEKYP